MKPFSSDFWRFVAIWYCVSIGICYHQSGISLFIYYGIMGCFISYAIMLLFHSLPNKAKTIYWVTILVLALINLVADVVIAETTGASFNFEHVTLILGTNISEGEEFFRSYMNMHLLTSISIIMLIGAFIILVLRSIDKSRIIVFFGHGLALAMLFLAVSTNVLKSEEWSRFFLLKSMAFMSYEPVPDLDQYRQIPEITLSEAGNLSPENIIIIIGESFSKNHSSIYGYEKETNPILGRMVQDSTQHVFAFDNVMAASTKTFRAFELMMTIASKSSPDSDEWLSDVKLFDLSCLAGYCTEWISNQSKVGMYDNIVTSIAQLSDTTLWAGHANSGYYKTDYDELLIPIVNSFFQSNRLKKNISVIHMIGSHPIYSSRYPSQYNYFKPDDYPGILSNQKMNIAQYDNSILYNDYVVSSIFEILKDMDAVILYFPDHGQDIYVSDPYYVGHAKDSDPISVKAASEIPFLVFVTDRYAQRNPTFLNSVISNSGRNYDTENIIYSIADLMGIESINGESIGDKSLFYVPEEK